MVWHSKSSLKLIRHFVQISDTIQKDNYLPTVHFLKHLNNELVWYSDLYCNFILVRKLCITNFGE